MGMNLPGWLGRVSGMIRTPGLSAEIMREVWSVCRDGAHLACRVNVTEGAAGIVAWAVPVAVTRPQG